LVEPKGNAMKKSERAKTRTGQVARVEGDQSAAGEPLPPPDLPEFPDVNGTTGVMRAVSEGEDGAKAGDDPTHSAPEPLMPRPRKSRRKR
jgi:hypothetical protein